MSYLPPTSAGWTSQVFGTRPGGFNPAGGHTGEDIAVPVGTPLRAMAEGVVVHVGYFKGRYSDNPWWIEPSFAGYVVTVDYGRYISHYAHCSGSPVLSGKRVQQGDVVAYSGNTGSATTGPHLHWEVMPDGWDFNNGTYGRIDPRSITGSGIAAAGTTITPQALPEEDELSEVTDDVKRIKQILEAQEGDRIRERIIAIDDRTARTGPSKYFRGWGDDKTIYENVAGSLRALTYDEWVVEDAKGEKFRDIDPLMIDKLKA